MRTTPGKAVQVDPIKPTLEAPGIKLLNLKYDEPLSKFAFKFNLRRYSPRVQPHQPHAAVRHPDGKPVGFIRDGGGLPDIAHRVI